MDTLNMGGSLAPEGFHVFLADDSDDDIVLFREAFGAIDSRIRCAVARNGKEAVETLTALKREGRLPDLVLMDVNMPVLDGCSAVRILREDIPLDELAIVVFSSSDLLEDAEVVYRAGANACVRKPDTYDKWVEAIRAVVSFYL
ncbi:response regulator [Pelagicoccus sp. NFK12]|uniref:Response regulator n=1 Tax=Pelagicoccus enzymogenes TaxID=2773457 RepID=A0A927F9K5_9BACT|nr:response regulator [Pelagicoccus enzymogenes]MBD5780834.1 response regulator [Pelagicoccus enzymogenes]